MAEQLRTAVIRNPRSGSAPEVAALESALRDGGLTAPVLDAPEGAELASWIDQVAQTHDVVVATGGDGTVSTVAAAAAKWRKTLGVIATGTLNHFARDAGIPIEIEDAIDVIRNGAHRCMDVGSINDRIFLNNVSIGNYPRMVHERERLEKSGRSRPVAAAMAIARTWWHLRKYTAELVIDEREIIRRSPFIVVGNGSYTLSGLSLGQRDQISDGKLSLYVAPPTGRIGVLALPLRALVGRLEEQEQFETFSASTIRIGFRYRRIGVAIDGEVLELAPPLEFKIRRQALRVMVPFDARSGREAAETLAQGRG